jgi:multidrug resistance efflux pump
MAQWPLAATGAPYKTSFHKKSAMQKFTDIKIEDELKDTPYLSFKTIYRITRKSRVRYWLLGFLIAIFIFLFLPWTQNVRGRGTVTTLRQEQRPQELPAIIPGRIARWYVKEGDLVKKGDTILKLTEIKDNYFDPNLLQRTREQIDAKKMSIENYKSKAGATDVQISALEQGRNLKVSQLQNKIRQQQQKVRADSMKMMAARNDYDIALKQYDRAGQMYKEDLISLTQYEQRNAVFQNASAKRTTTEIEFSNTRQDLGVLQLELSGAIQEYNEKISKASGDRFQSMSEVAGGSGEVAKLENQYMNYDMRNQLYYIIAPQDGQVTDAKKAGIGEIVKEGEKIVEIVPREAQYAVEMFIRPMDVPLLEKGQTVRLVFDGFPALVFSGWPKASSGTFGGKVVAIENASGYGGKYRILIGEDPNDKPWPKEIRIGAGAMGMALLKDVPVWYELWRNINGFPPEYYKTDMPQPALKK